MNDDDIEVVRMSDIMNGQPTEFVTPERYEEEIIRIRKEKKDGNR